MLLPSPFSCDSAQSSATRLQAALFVSPPASPPATSSQTTIGNLVTTCRSLQSLLATTPAAPADLAGQLPTPPLAHSLPPLKLRLRPRTKAEGTNDGVTPRKKIVKRAPPRGANKRRRAAEDDMGRDDVEADENNDVESDLEISVPASASSPHPPHTPKRARIAPEVLPLGLERADYHDLHLAGRSTEETSTNPGTDVQIEADGEEWSTEDDKILVELVLEKLKLSKTEWQDCARSLGKDRHSVGRRWKSLMVNGDIGLKPRSRARAKIHGTWR